MSDKLTDIDIIECLKCLPCERTRTYCYSVYPLIMAIFISLSAHFIFLFPYCHCLSRFHHFIPGLFRRIWGSSQKIISFNLNCDCDHLHNHLGTLWIFRPRQKDFPGRRALTFQATLRLKSAQPHDLWRSDDPKYENWVICLL